MDKKTENKLVVNGAMRRFIIREEPFTSVDIANEVKHSGAWVRNRDISNFLKSHMLSATGGDIEYNFKKSKYIVSAITIHTGQQALLYHPVHYDPAEYLKRDTEAITPDIFEQLHGVSPFQKSDACSDDCDKCDSCPNVDADETTIADDIIGSILNVKISRTKSNGDDSYLGKKIGDFIIDNIPSYASGGLIIGQSESAKFLRKHIDKVAEEVRENAKVSFNFPM